MNDPNDKATRAIEKVGEVRERAIGKVEEARDRAQEGIQQGKTHLADQIETVAQAVRESTRHLRDAEQPQLADYAEKLGQGVERVSSYVRTHDVQALIHDVEHFARRQPALFFGGAFALGLLGGRFLRSSQRAAVSSLENDYGTSSSSSGESSSYASGGGPSF